MFTIAVPAESNEAIRDLREPRSEPVRRVTGDSLEGRKKGEAASKVARMGPAARKRGRKKAGLPDCCGRMGVYWGGWKPHRVDRLTTATQSALIFCSLPKQPRYTPTFGHSQLKFPEPVAEPSAAGFFSWLNDWKKPKRVPLRQERQVATAFGPRHPLEPHQGVTFF